MKLKFISSALKRKGSSDWNRVVSKWKLRFLEFFSLTQLVLYLLATVGSEIVLQSHKPVLRCSVCLSKSESTFWCVLLLVFRKQLISCPHLMHCLRRLIGVWLNLLRDSFEARSWILHNESLLDNVNVQVKQWIAIVAYSCLCIQHLNQLVHFTAIRKSLLKIKLCRAFGFVLRITETNKQST